MVGIRLKAMRERAGLTQEDLGARLGVAGQQVSRWEREENVPGSDKLAEMARIFATSSDYLLGLTDSPSPRPEELSDDEQEMLAFYRRRQKS